MKKMGWAVLALLAAFLWNMPTASAAPTPIPSSTQGCTDLFNSGTNAGGAVLTKTVTGVTYLNGSATITFTLTSSRSASDLALVTRIRDCAFVDADGDGGLDAGEQVFSFDLRFAAGTFVNGAEYSVTVTAADGAKICDRAGVSSDALLTGFTDKSTNPDGSQSACTTDTPIPAGAIGGLALAGVVGLLFLGFQVRSRRTRPVAGGLAH